MNRRSLYQMGLGDGVGADSQATADALVQQVKMNFKKLMADNPRGLTDSPQETSVHGAIDRLGNDIDKWTGKLYQQAVAGKNAQGRAYTWADWSDMGASISDALKYQGANELDSTRLHTLKLTWDKSVDDTEKLAKKVSDAIPDSETWGQLAIGVGVLAAGVVVYKLVK